MPLDTQKLTDKLQASGFTAEQASALAEAADLVTKEHMDASPLTLEQRLTIRLGGMLVVAVGILLAAIRYLPAPPHP
jgi:hypothetical protein